MSVRQSVWTTHGDKELFKLRVHFKMAPKTRSAILQLAKLARKRVLVSPPLRIEGDLIYRELKVGMKTEGTELERQFKASIVELQQRLDEEGAPIIKSEIR